MNKSITSGQTNLKTEVCTIYLISKASSFKNIYKYYKVIYPVPITSHNKNKSKYL